MKTKLGLNSSPYGMALWACFGESSPGEIYIGQIQAILRKSFDSQPSLQCSL